MGTANVYASLMINKRKTFEQVPTIPWQGGYLPDRVEGALKERGYDLNGDLLVPVNA